MNVVIIEDENLIARNLQKMLMQIDSSINVVATLGSVADAVNWINNNPEPDLYFMDIQLSDGISFDIFKKATINKPVVFATAYNEYAIRAFKVNSVDYLLKPIDKEYLAAAIDKYKKYYAQNNNTLQLQLHDLISSLNQNEAPKYKERFLAHYKSGIIPVPENRVAYFVKDAIIYLITSENEKLVTDYNTIDEIEEVVNPAHLFRANRQTIVHIQQVESYKKHDTGKIELHLKCDKNTRIDISREKANEFIKWLDQ